MKLKIRVKDRIIFDSMSNELGKTLFIKRTQLGKLYTTKGGVYEILPGGIIIFDGKRGSFGKSKYLKVSRKSKWLRKDQLIITVGDKDFDIDIEVLETSADYKPFWATCSDKKYMQLKMLKAR